MKRIFIFTILASSTLFSIEEKLKRAIARNDARTVAQLVEQVNIQHEQGERGLAQTVGRQTLKILYQAADKAEQQAAADAATHFNHHNYFRMVKVLCCATGFGYQAANLYLNWDKFNNWTEAAVGVSICYQGCYDFYHVLTNTDAKNEHAKAQAIKRDLSDLHASVEKKPGVFLDDLERGK